MQVLCIVLTSKLQVICVAALQLEYANKADLMRCLVQEFYTCTANSSSCYRTASSGIYAEATIDAKQTFVRFTPAAWQNICGIEAI